MLRRARSGLSVLGVWVMTLAFAPDGFAAAPSNREELKRALRQVVESAPLKDARVSVDVVSLDKGDSVFSYRPNELLNPASNVKLVTSAVALTKLGTNFRWDTEFLTDAPLSNGSAKTLFVRGKGDPSLNSERLQGIITLLKLSGLKDVGDIVLDDTFFDSERIAPGYEQENSDRAYMAPNGALSINANVVGVYVRATAPGLRAVVELDTPSDYFNVKNDVVTRGRLRRVYVNSDAAGEKQNITVRGVVPPDRASFPTWKKVDHPPLYFGQTFKAMLKERGVSVRGKVKLGTVPEHAKILHVSQSDSLDVVLRRLNKNSINFVAEQLMKTMGAEFRGAPGTMQKGVSVVEEVLETNMGIPRGTYVMKNGSGLNDTNRFSTAQLSRILQFMATQMQNAPEYLASLGIAGKDGTLKYRFEGSDALGRLRAKTGTLQNTSALSGYVQAANAERFVFSIIVNDYPVRAESVTRSIDALGVALASSGSALGPKRTLAALSNAEKVLSPMDEATARVRTYLAFSAQKDPRNLTFLRTSWRAEKDPAVRSVIAEAMIRSNPEDYSSVRALLESLLPHDDVIGRLRKIAATLNIDTPAVPALVEVAAEGNVDALTRLVELVGATTGDAAANAAIGKDLAEVAGTAGDELVRVLKTASAKDRDASVEALAKGMVTLSDSGHPFWPSLKKALGSLDSELAQFAKELEVRLSVKIAEVKAPAESPAPTSIPAKPQRDNTPPNPESRPGG